LSVLGISLVILFHKRVTYVKKVNNHCSRPIFGSQHYNSLHFKVSTITNNDMVKFSYDVLNIKPEKWPGAVYSISKSWALWSTHTNNDELCCKCYQQMQVIIVLWVKGQEKGLNQLSHTNSVNLIWYLKEQTITRHTHSWAPKLNKYLHDIQVWQMWKTPLNQTSQIKCSNLQSQSNKWMLWWRSRQNYPTQIWLW